MRGPRIAWPQRTTAIAGALLAAAAVATVPMLLGLALPLLDDLVVPMTGPVPMLIRGLLLLLGFAVLALGARGELGIAGRSVPGAVALLVFGARDLVNALLNLIPVGDAAVVPDPVRVLWFAEGALYTVLTIASGAVAVVAVLRARVLIGLARWVLVPFVALRMLMALANWVPGLLLLLAPFDVGALLEVALLLLAGLVLLGYGRSEAVRHRLEVIRDAW